MLQAGDPIPDTRVWLAPRERVSIRALAAERPLLILTFLFAWAKSQ
jgi:hypothetical protein